MAVNTNHYCYSLFVLRLVCPYCWPVSEPRLIWLGLLLVYISEGQKATTVVNRFQAPARPMSKNLIKREWGEEERGREGGVTKTRNNETTKQRNSETAKQRNN